MIAVFGALEAEIGDIKKRMTIDREAAEKDCMVYEGSLGNKQGILVLTGMGKDRAEKAAEYALDKYPVTVVVSTGVSGALNNRSQAGDFVLCNFIKTETGEDVTLKSDSSLLFLAEHTLHKSSQHRLVGTGITVTKVCSTPEEKNKLADSAAADVVDMESYWICRAAAKRKIPFVAIRPVFDTANDDISVMSRIMTDGKVVPVKLTRNLFAHPNLAVELVRFGNISRKISKSLADFIYEYVEIIPQR
jgi:adenosylhomocysteine nucleosidase